MNLKDDLGETNLYDKKEKLEVNKPKSWLKSVSAFANDTRALIRYIESFKMDELYVIDFNYLMEDLRYEILREIEICGRE